MTTDGLVGPGRRGITRGRFLRLGGALLGVACLPAAAGCGGSGSENVRLRVLWQGSEARHKRTREAIRLFQERREGLDLVPEPAGADGYFERLTTQVSGGSPPDVFQLNPVYMAQYAARGVLRNLDEFGPDTLDLSGLDEAVLQGVSIDGAPYGVPLGSTTPAVIYSTSALEKIGVKPASRLGTWDEFAEMAGAVAKEMGEGVYGTGDSGGSEADFEVWVRQRGKELYTGEGELNITRDELKEWLSYWEDLRKSGAAVPPEITTQATTTETSPLVGGKAAFEFDFGNLLTAYQDLVEDGLGLAMLPGGSEGSKPGQHLTSVTMGIYGKSGVAEEAAAMLDFFINDEGAIKALGAERGAPGSQRARDLVEPQLTEPERKVIEYVEFVLSDSTPRQVFPPAASSEIRTTILPAANEAVETFFSDAKNALS